jgi:hypothetical protein
MKEQEERVDQADGPISASSLHLNAPDQWIAYLTKVRWAEAAYQNKLLRVGLGMVLDQVDGKEYLVVVDEVIIDDHFRDSRQECFLGVLVT